MREYIDAAGHYVQRLAETSTFKMVWAAVMWVIHTLFGPTVRPALIAVLTLCFLDLVAGTIAAWLNPREYVNSRRAREGFVKIILYLIVLAAGYQVHVIGGPIIGPFGQGFLEAMAGGTEVLSVLENADRAFRYVGREIPWLRRLIKAIRGRQDAALAELEKGG